MLRPHSLARRSPAGLLGVLALLLLLASCARRPPPHAAPEPQPASASLRAGAAKVDITPMPGVPLACHSFEGGMGYAVWTRLWARAIYLEDAHGEPLVLVVADLWGIPAGLADAVVVRVRERHGLTQIGRAQLSLSATHTHHSPGAFSTQRLYSRAAATRMGFDPALFEFLTDRIAAAVAEAVASRAPARLRLATRPVAGVARNRSLAPFLENPEAPLILAANAELPTCPDAPKDAGTGEVDPCHAVDPTLTTLRIEDLDGRPRAIAAFFAAHATAMVNATDAYNGDFFAVAVATAEVALGEARPDLGEPVVALFNGPEGDVSPNWTTQGRGDALALGAALGQAIAQASVAEGPGCGQLIDGAIESGFRRLPLAARALEGQPGASTARRSLGGAAILGGAEDGRTRHHRRLPEGQTVKRQRRPGHGPKKPAIPPALYALVFPGKMVPDEVPLAVHRVGPLTFVGLPGEFTTTMGMRVREAVAQTGPAGAPRPLAIGLAGEYLSYFATPQEYALQHYEGGSTLWGQYAGVLVAEALGALAASVELDGQAVASTSAGDSAHVDPGQRRSFALAPGRRSRRALAGLGDRLREQLAIEAPIHELPRLELDSAAPAWDGPAIWPSARVELQGEDGSWAPLRDGGVVVDERGDQFLMFPIRVERERWTWAIWWLGEIPADARALRLRALGPDGGEACSQPFGPGHVPAPDAVDCAAHPEPVAAGPRALGAPR